MIAFHLSAVSDEMPVPLRRLPGLHRPASLVKLLRIAPRFLPDFLPPPFCRKSYRVKSAPKNEN
jgi:hypothetical protein